jgi:hypothetical protein
MSGKFGLMDDADESANKAEGKIDLSGFAPVKKRSPINLAEIDAAAAPHGFISREAVPITAVAAPITRRRRAVPAEPARQLAVRLVESQYARFLAYADKYQLTYHDAIKKLLDDAGE